MKLSRKGKNNRRRSITFLLVSLIVYYIYNPYNFIEIHSPIKLHQIDKVDPHSFWHSPWGESGVHKGVDIFSGRGSIIYSAVKGIVFRSGYGTIGGHYVYILGVDCRLHYYAHLDTIIIEDNVLVSHTTAVV
jgi:murein DD-endopeptidase MepM/ murein hydrolase activator NlpD